MREASYIGTASKRTAATLVALLATAVVLVLASPAKAEVIAVNNANDPGDGTCEQPNGCTLREAIEKANATTQKDGIVFNLPDDSTITLTQGELAVSNDLIVLGATVNNLTVSGNNASRVFGIYGGAEVTIEGLAVKNGVVTNEWPNEGGGILNYGTLTLKDSSVSGSKADFGGGISSIKANNSAGKATLVNSIVSGNSATRAGGGLDGHGGTLTITDSSVSENVATTGGGGGATTRGNGTIELTNSTVSDNYAPNGHGGGISNGFGTVKLTGSTVSNNKAKEGSGGLYNGNIALLVNSTITKNTAPSGKGSGVSSWGDRTHRDIRTEVKGTTIAGNNGTDVDYVGGGSTNTFKSLGSNKIGDGNAVQAFNQPGDWVGPPTIGALSPRPGSFTRDTTPTVAATVRSGLSNLSRPNIKLYVDGRRKTNFSYNRATDRLSYTAGRLANKRHTAKIVATDGWGNTKTRSWSFTVDGAKPTVSRLSPKSRTFDRTPTIRATVKDNATNLRKGNIKLYIDGKRKKNFKYNVRRDRLSYTSARLSYKRHSAKIVAKDTAGNVSVKSWRFKVEKR